MDILPNTTFVDIRESDTVGLDNVKEIYSKGKYRV